MTPRFNQTCEPLKIFFFVRVKGNKNTQKTNNIIPTNIGGKAMKTDFLCPKCSGYLSVGENVIFNIRNRKNVGGLLLLSPSLGDYTYTMHPSYQISPGEDIDFYCPICHASLSVKGIENLASILMIDEKGLKHHVVFSKKEGEQCTYKVSDQVIEKYGLHAQNYLDFISASMLK